jgi:threonine/homoserine/homoserine lactone efflux protein
MRSGGVFYCLHDSEEAGQFMEISFFLRGLLIGLSIAATVGPMFMLCVQRTLQKGYRYGMLSGMGIATADGIYGSIAGFGLTTITAFLLHQQAWIRLIGGLFLLYLGIKTLLAKPAERAATVQGGNLLGAYFSTLALTLTNPTTILSFMAIFMGLGIGNTGGNYVAALLVVLGVFLGSTCWWLILTGSIGLLHGKFPHGWLHWLNRGSGAIIAIFGLIALVSLHW